MGVSHTAIENRISKEKWKKGALKPIIEKKIAQTMVDKFTEIGLTPEKVMRLINDGMGAEKTVIIGGGDQAFAQEVEDWVARDKFITQYYKLTGAYATTKQEVVATNTNINYTPDNLSTLTDEELLELQRITSKLTES